MCTRRSGFLGGALCFAGREGGDAIPSIAEVFAASSRARADNVAKLQVVFDKADDGKD